MRNMVFTPPSFAFIVGTRVALAVGVGLLLSGRLPASRRRAVGATLVALGAATTIPAALSVFRSFRGRGQEAFGDRDEHLIGVTRFPRKGDDDEF